MLTQGGTRGETSKDTKRAAVVGHQSTELGSGAASAPTAQEAAGRAVLEGCGPQLG